MFTGRYFPHTYFPATYFPGESMVSTAETFTPTEVVTLCDLVSTLIDRSMAPESDARTIRLLTTSVQQAIRDLPTRNKWKHYNRLLRFRTTASFTPEVEYTESTRTMVITDGENTWPSDATSGEIVYSNTTFDVQQRVDDTTIILKDQGTIGDDYEGEVTWQRTRYRFNNTFAKVHYLVNLDSRMQLTNLDVPTFYERIRLSQYSGMPTIFTLMSSSTANATDIVVSSPGETSYLFEALVTVLPNIPKIYKMTASDGILTNESTTFTSDTAEFNASCETAVLRLYDTTDDIPYGLPRWESFIDSCESGQELTLSSAAIKTESNSVYVVSSYVDIDPGLMRTLVENMAYANYCQNHDHNGLAQAKALADQSLIRALAADSKLNHSAARGFNDQIAAANWAQYAQVDW